jgi:hydrogenase-4 component B
MFLVGAVAICGLPPLNGFVSEWFIYGSLFAGATNGLGGSGAAPAIGLVSLALMGGLALACFAKVVGVVFLGEPRDSRLAVHPTPPLMKIAMTGLACACVFIGVLPGLWVPLTQRASSELVQALPSAVAPAIRDMLAPATTLTAMALIFVCFVVILTLIRRSRQAAATARDQAGAGVSLTWGCAFTVPTARMQYTASSFAASLIASFRAMLWPEKIQALPAGVFPLAARLETHTPDIAEHELFTPMFRAVARAFAMLRTVSWSGDSGGRATATDQRHGALHTLAYALVTALRRGSIQVRLAYIVLTLILLLLIESLTLSPRTSAHSRALPDVVATPVARGEP